MTLTETLQIRERYLKFEDMRALDYAEKRWQESGCPTNRWEIVNFLEQMLQELKASGTGYPKVLLLRKKEIQRNAFAIEKPGEFATQAERCPLCSGTGWAANIGGYNPCTCPAGKPHRERLEKWGMKL
jgi:hypothetical protein